MLDTYTTSGQATDPPVPAMLRLGFRPFFLGALIFAELTVALWTLVHTFSLPLALAPISPFQWHAHEMIYGYGLAVIAGFLLTAVRNWTGEQTVHGWPLLGLVGLWAGARISMFAGTGLLYAAAVLDLSFMALLMMAVAKPVIRARQWKQVGILSKLSLLAAGNVLFYMGCFGYLEQGVYWGIYGGLYLVVGLILTVGRRVIPSFIQSGVGYPVSLFNSRWVDIASLVLFLALFVVAVFTGARQLVPYLAAALFAVNAVRLAGWHTPGIWRKPLLWSLYLAYGFIVAGFLLLALSGFAGVSRFAAVHALAYGGIALITMSMMARVSIGHTGRDIHTPPPLVWHALATLVAGSLVRVVLPLAAPAHYLAWIALSQLLWLVAFGLMAAVLVPILVAPRADGRYG